MEPPGRLPPSQELSSLRLLSVSFEAQACDWATA